MPTRVLVTIAACIGIACTFVGVIVVTESTNERNAPLIATVLGFVTLVLTQLLTGKSVETSVRHVDHKVDRVLNGEMDEKIRNAVDQVLTEHDASGYHENDSTHPTQESDHDRVEDH